MRIPISDALHDPGSLEPMTVLLEQRQVAWLKAFAESREVSPEQAVRYIVNRFIRSASAPAAETEASSNASKGDLLSELRTTYARLQELEDRLGTEHTASDDPSEAADGEAASPDAQRRDDPDSGGDAPAPMIEADPPSMFEMVEEGARTPDSDVPPADVRFGGDWDAEARDAVRTALHRLEGARSPRTAAFVQPVWMCTAIASDDGSTFYFATRQDEASVVRAVTPDQLIARLERWMHTQ